MARGFWFRFSAFLKERHWIIQNIMIPLGFSPWYLNDIEKRQTLKPKTVINKDCESNTELHLYMHFQHDMWIQYKQKLKLSRTVSIVCCWLNKRILRLSFWVCLVGFFHDLKKKNTIHVSSVSYSRFPLSDPRPFQWYMYMLYKYLSNMLDSMIHIWPLSSKYSKTTTYLWFWLFYNWWQHPAPPFWRTFTRCFQWSHETTFLNFDFKDYVYFHVNSPSMNTWSTGKGFAQFW